MSVTVSASSTSRRGGAAKLLLRSYGVTLLGRGLLIALLSTHSTCDASRAARAALNEIAYRHAH